MREDIPYKYVRIGRELDDLEEESYDCNEKLLTTISIERTIKIE